MATARQGHAAGGRLTRISPVKAWLLGGVTVAVLDGLDAFVFFGLRGVSPARVLQSVASGVLGRAAFQGGIATVMLGLLLHFLIALTIVAIFFAAARTVPFLTRRPYLAGPLFGLVAYGVMTFVVVPMSAAVTGGTPAGPVLMNGLLIHAFGVGLPAALAARAAFGGEVLERGPGS